MTVSKIAIKTDKQAKNGGGVYSFNTFSITDTEDLKVLQTDADGLEEDVLSTAYTLTLLEDGTGYITYAGLPDGYTVTVYRETDTKQEVDIKNQGGFFPEVIEGALDRLTMMVQELHEKAERSVKMKISDSTTKVDELLENLTENAADAEVAKTAAEAAQVAAETAKTDAEAAQTAAEAAVGGVKVSGDDDTADDLETKLLVGTGLSASTQFGGATETRTLAINATTTPQLNAASEWTKAQNFNATTLSDAATVAWDTESNQVTTVTLGDNRIMGAPTNLKDGGVYVLGVYQDGTGSRTLSWNAVFKFPAATAPTLTTTASAKDFFSFISDGTNLYLFGQSLDVG
jgi:hypothetical protein